jgi:hypothetical protein
MYASQRARMYRLPCSFIILALYSVCLLGQAESNTAKPAQQATTGSRDGQHDFDFIYGKWRMPNHRLVKRLAGSHDWEDFISCDEGMALVGGLGNMDILRTNYWKDFVGITIRTYDPESGLWRLYWFDNRFSHGEIQPQLWGNSTATWVCSKAGIPSTENPLSCDSLGP